jgi:hypothetical protein
MCFAFLRTASSCTKFCFFVLVFLFVVGPLLIIAGIVFLGISNRRAELVAEYNHVVAQYRGVDEQFMGLTTMQMSGGALLRRYLTVPVQGDRDGVADESHYVFSRGGMTRPVGDQYTAIVRVNGGAAQFVTYTLPHRSAVKLGLICDMPRCTDKCDREKYDCDEIRMGDYCVAAFGGTYDDDIGGCSAGDTCGTCTFTGSLSRACIVMAFDTDGTARPSSKYQSCYYPFDHHEYVPSASSATIEVMSENDPFIALQRLTDGRNDFGITAKEQRDLGVVLLVTGAGVAIVFALVIYVFVRWEHATHRRKVFQRRAPAEASKPPPEQYTEPDRPSWSHHQHHHHSQQQQPQHPARQFHRAHPSAHAATVTGTASQVRSVPFGAQPRCIYG